jgi:nitrite reductase/ring-hydroxylating ferredoxin subunit
MRHALFGEDELAPGDMRAVDVDGLAIVVARTPDGAYRAIRDICPHYGTPLSHGTMAPLWDGSQPGEYHQQAQRYVLRCPWHGYEYDLTDGRCPADPKRYRVRAYDVTTEGGTVYLER